MRGRWLVLWLACSASLFAQGTILFNNRTPTGDARVWRIDGTGAGAGITAGLYLVSTVDGSLTLLQPTTTFRTSAASSFFVNAVTVEVPGIPAGSPATVRMRAWSTADGSFEAAGEIGGSYIRGQSNDILIPQLGGNPPSGGPPIPPPGLSDLQSFGLFIPSEPSPVLIAAIGAAAMGVFGMRKRRAE